MLTHRLWRRRLRALGFVRDGIEEPHAFTARPRVSYVDTVGLVKNQDGAGALPYLDRLIRRSLVDNDGTPAKWEPAVVDGEHTAPDGTTAPAEDLPKYTAFEAGSSRRRWASTSPESPSAPRSAPSSTCCSRSSSVPRVALEQWLRKRNPVLWKIRPPDRETWGMSPEQQAAMATLAGTSIPR